MDLTALKSNGANLSASQQGSFYYARKRRRERENATAAQFKAQSPLGVAMIVELQVE